MTSFVTNRTAGGHASSRLPRRRRYSARPFVWSLIIVSILLTSSLLTARIQRDAHTSDTSTLLRRDALDPEDLPCHLVHGAQDQCAFVLQNCADEEAGLLSYLQLYYCRLPQAKPLVLAIIIVWLCLLFSTIGIAASDFFCINLSTISSILGMSESLAGVTLLAFGNGSPDVFSTFAAMNSNSGSLAVGELFGAAGFITAVVAGSMALVRPFRVNRKSFVRDICFFLVSASFSLVFLWDGKLYLWECIVMVGFYLFYVAFVVAWHWWLGQRKKRRIRDAAARGQYVSIDVHGDIEPIEPYRDDDEGDTGTEETPRHMVEDFPSLEANPEDSNEDEVEAFQERALGRLSSNMRLARPSVVRRPTVQIRPSLVGALEFRSVLHSLQKSRNIRPVPIHLRRYSEDPTTMGQPPDQRSPIAGAGSRSLYSASAAPAAHPWALSRSRSRALSAIDSGDISPGTSIPPDANRNFLSPHHPPGSPSRSTLAPPSPLGSVPPTSPLTDGASTPPPRTNSGDFLKPPPVSRGPFFTAPTDRHDGQHPGPSSTQTRPSPTLVIPGRESEQSTPTGTVPFPPYADPVTSTTSSKAPSIRLPSSIIPADYFPQTPDLAASGEQSKPLSWWPYRLLPSPTDLFSVLFPTLYSWNDKNIWERALGIVAAPSVFLLTITLPVVENDKMLEDEEYDQSLPATLSQGNTETDWRKSMAPYRDDVPAVSSGYADERGPSVVAHDRAASYHPFETAAELAASHQRVHDEHAHEREPRPQNHLFSPSEARMLDSPTEMPSASVTVKEEESWDRWLTIVQVFTAPFFVVLIVWANMEASPKALLQPSLIALLVSFVLLLIILQTTTPSRPPKWRQGLCIVGFIVSVSWISTIAGEVVGVLKTLGVIFNISDAILGLTIFAVGNSLGDLVADITVARLGYPVMALSACFGGPMLNILLGVGLSGGYMTIWRANHDHEAHPDEPLLFHPYLLDVSRSLIISGIALVFTLIGLLIIVPARGWKMDRWVGTVLLILWVVITTGNVIAELFIFERSG